MAAKWVMPPGRGCRFVRRLSCSYLDQSAADGEQTLSEAVSAPVSDDRLLSAQADLVARSSLGALYFSLAVVGLVSAALWSVARPEWVVAWAVFMVIVGALRYLHLRDYANTSKKDVDIRRFQKWFVVGAAFGGIGWGTCGGFLFPAEDVVYQSFLSFVLSGITAASIIVYSPIKLSARLFLGFALVPLICAHFLQGDQVHFAMGTVVLIYTVFLFRLASIVNNSLINSLAVGFENDELISELKKAKISFEAANQKLKAEIAVRNQTEEELIDARDKAEQGARAKSDFLATMSHEIRTPMNGVLGMTELLMNTELAPKQYRFADTVRRSGEALLAIINDILDFSKIEAGKLDIQHTVFDLRQLVEDTMAFFAEQAHRKKIELFTIFPPDEHAAYRGDPERIRQILMNLLGNAIKFTECGEISVNVTTTEEREDINSLRFEVTDSGVGIEEAHQAHIFESFQQADATTTRQYGGTGLGLAICSRLAELMHGTVGVTSKPNVGSTFWFTIELTRMAASSISDPVKHTIDLSGTRVLVIDDNETNCEILRHQMLNWDMKFYAANSAEHGLKYLKKGAACGKAFDLAVLDRMLPDTDGVDLARRIKGDPEIADTRLIMLSSIDQLEQTGQWYMAGIEVYINKPVRQGELHDAISSALGDRVKRSTAGEGSRDNDASVRENLRDLGAHVLLVEDNPVNQEFAKSMLENSGCTVVVADNGQDAFEAIAEAPLDRQQRRYDVILMDCQMPLMDGFDATREIRKWEAESSDDTPLPIVALTANAMSGDRERCLAAGMSDYLSKPFDQEQLARVVKRWLTLDVEMTHMAKQTAQRALPVADSAGAGALADLDNAALNNIRALQKDGSNAILTKIINMYLTNSPQLLEKLQEAAATGNGELLRASAHSLKSASANLGAKKLAELCQQLETLGRDDKASEAVATLGIVEFEFEAVCNALGRELGDKAA